MEENIKDIESISNEDLLELYSKVLEHLDYLGEKIITENKEEETENSEEKEAGGDKNE